MRVAILALLPALGCWSSPITTEEQQALERQFEESMAGAVLVGHFTLFPVNDGDGGGDAPGLRLRSERYEIDRVVKRAGDLWTFHARIRFGETDVTVPVPVQLTWAGDTPVVGVTDLGIPGMGTYTARVAFYRDSYAGMWWGGKHGGNLFGIVERPSDR